MAKNKTQVSNYNICDIVAIRSGRSRREVNEVYKEIADTLIEQLAAGHEVVLNGIAKFELVDRPSRNARNPRTGEAVVTKPKTVVKVRNRSRLHNFFGYVAPERKKPAEKEVKAYLTTRLQSDTETA